MVMHITTGKCELLLNFASKSMGFCVCYKFLILMIFPSEKINEILYFEKKGKILETISIWQKRNLLDVHTG